jgi:beta-galactosidase
VEFSISGPGVIAGVGNADGKDETSYQSNRRKLFQGRALVVVRMSRQPGVIRLTAKTTGLQESDVTVEAQPVAEAPELN